MKTTLSLLSCFLLLSPALGEEQSSKELLRDGLFEEEVNQDYQKAKAAYQSVTKRYDKERYFAGLAFFRLAEIARKSGNQGEAAILYRRVAGEFADQKEIAKRALAILGEEGSDDKNPVSAPTSPSDAEALELQRLKKMERDSPDLLNGVGEDGWHPLHKAAANGWTNAIDYLLARKVKIDPRATIKAENKSEGYTPLHLAVIHGHLTVVDQLLAAKADPGLVVQLKPADLPLTVQSNSIPKDRRGNWSPLHFAILFQRREIMAHLLKAKAPLTAGGPPVGTYDTSTTYQNGASRSRSWDFGATPLILAVWLNDMIAFRALIEQGADINQAASEDGETPLLAAIWKNSELVPTLIEQGAKVTDQFTFGRTALHWAIEKCQTPIVRRIIEEGADVNVRVKLNRYSSERNPSPLEAVMRWNSDQEQRDELCVALLAAGARPTPRALSNATSNGEFQIISAFIKAGVDVNGSIHDGDRPLHFVQHAKAAKILIDAGAKLELKNHGGVTPFGNIVERQNDTPESRALIDYMLEKGADTSVVQNRLSNLGDSPLLPYVMSKTLLLGKSNPGAIMLAFPRNWKVATGENQILPGTPAPTLQQLLRLNYQTLVDESVNFPRNGNRPGRSSEPLVVTDLVIYRLDEKGELGEVAQLADQEISRKPTPALQWGDLVLFRVSLKENDKQQMPLVHYIDGLESRTVTFKVGAWEHKVNIENSPLTTPGLALRDHFSSELEELIDLTKITLRRAGGEAKTINLSLTHDPKKIRLIDGDVIEYSLKKQVDPSAEDPFAPSSSRMIQIFFPDRPVRTEIYHRQQQITLSEVLENSAIVGGRDYSKLQIQRMGKDGLKKIPLDLLAASRRLTDDESTMAKALELLKTPILPGDILVVPPRENVSWDQRNSFTNTAQDAGIGTLIKLTKPKSTSRKSRPPIFVPPKKATTRSNNRPRVVLPKSR